MELTEQKHGEVAVLTISGTATNAQEVAPIYEKVRLLINQGIVKVVVDLSQMKWLESSFLNVMTKSFKTLRDAGGDMILVGANRKIQKILRLTHLTRIFQTLDTVDQALTGYKDQSFILA